MSDCVFDIETAPIDDAEIPAAFVEKLQTMSEDDDPEAWREKLGLFSLSASVVTIAMINPDSGGGLVLYDDRHGTLEDLEQPDGINAQAVGGDEKTILQHFWKTVTEFDRVVSYNGRGFDVPFLMQRSLIREVPLTKNLMPPRWNLGSTHLDLQEVLSQFRATRPYGLAAWTQAVGLTSPKDGEVAGAEVGEFFHAGKVRPIVEYCLRDVAATAALYRRLRSEWAPMFTDPPRRV